MILTFLIMFDSFLKEVSVRFLHAYSQILDKCMHSCEAKASSFLASIQPSTSMYRSVGVFFMRQTRRAQTLPARTRRAWMGRAQGLLVKTRQVLRSPATMAAKERRMWMGRARTQVRAHQAK